MDNINTNCLDLFANFRDFPEVSEYSILIGRK